MTAASSDLSEEEEQLSLDPPEQGEDDDEEHEEPTAAEILQAAVAQGQLDKEMVPIDLRDKAPSGKSSKNSCQSITLFLSDGNTVTVSTNS